MEKAQERNKRESDNMKNDLNMGECRRCHVLPFVYSMVTKRHAKSVGFDGNDQVLGRETSRTIHVHPGH